MSELRDMGAFPNSVYIGASANIIFSIYLTRLIFLWGGGSIFYLLPWAVLLPSLNVLPVTLLRRREKLSNNPYPEISQMNFFRDQHRFSSWVYAVAAANMFFWIVFSWWILSFSTHLAVLFMLQICAALITFVPIWRRYHPSLS